MRVTLLKIGMGILGLAAASPAMGASSVSLSLLVDPAAHTWQAFAGVNDAASAGLAGIAFDVTSTGNITLSTVTQGNNNDLPTGIFSDFTQVGFALLHQASNVTSTDVRIQGGQNSTASLSPDGTGESSVMQGFGKSAGNYNAETPFGGHVKPSSWAAVAQIGHGTFTGDTGSITIAGDAAATSLLPASVPTNGTTFQTHSPDTVTGQVVPVSAVPEPSSLLGVAVLGGVACFRRRRSA